jgi:hypothetical protein
MRSAKVVDAAHPSIARSAAAPLDGPGTPAGFCLTSAYETLTKGWSSKATIGSDVAYAEVHLSLARLFLVLHAVPRVVHCRLQSTWVVWVCHSRDP